MRYRDSIRAFMRALGAGKCIVVVLDDGYLRSTNCMFELTEIAKDSAFAPRVFPVVMSDAAIFRPIDRLEYIKHWETEIHRLDTAMREVGQENLQGIREELDLYERIRNMVAGIVDVLADMNALTPEMHRGAKLAVDVFQVQGAHQRVLIPEAGRRVGRPQPPIMPRGDEP